MIKGMEKYQVVERSIITKFRKSIYSKVIKAVKDFQLINENDKIMVCMSGGKDSFLLAKCVEELHKHGHVKFDVCYVVMNPGYNSENIKKIKENAQLLNINIEIFETDIFNVVTNNDFKSPCYFCAKMRRGHLYNKAKELGCNKIALGHHFDDVIETTLLSMFYGAEIKTMLPKVHSENFEGIDLIRPLYYVKEADIIAWKRDNQITFINCACRFTEACSTIDDGTSKRLEMKKLITKLRAEHKNIDDNIFNALCNVNLNCVLGYHKDKQKYHFTDFFSLV